MAISSELVFQARILIYSPLSIILIVVSLDYQNSNYLLTDSEVFTGKYKPSDGEVNMTRPRFEIFP